MSKKYLWVTDAMPAEVESKTGLRGVPTPDGGTLVEKPKPFNIDAEMAKLDRILNPSRCTCGAWAIIHRPNCPAAGGVT